jgi:hypothetical protein
MKKLILLFTIIISSLLFAQNSNKYDWLRYQSGDTIMVDTSSYTTFPAPSISDWWYIKIKTDSTIFVSTDSLFSSYITISHNQYQLYDWDSGHLNLLMFPALYIKNENDSSSTILVVEYGGF